MAEKKTVKKSKITLKTVDAMSMHRLLNLIPFVRGEEKLSVKLRDKILDAVFDLDDIVSKHQKEVETAGKKLRPDEEIYNKIVRLDELENKLNKEKKLSDDEVNEYADLKQYEPGRKKYLENLNETIQGINDREISIDEIKFTNEEFKEIRTLVSGMEHLEMVVGDGKIIRYNPTSFLSMIRSKFVI